MLRAFGSWAKTFFLTVLFTKQGIYVHLTIRKKDYGRQKNQVNLISIYH